MYFIHFTFYVQPSEIPFHGNVCVAERYLCISMDLVLESGSWRAESGWGGRPTAVVLLECLDFSDVNNGQDPEAKRLGELLFAVFEPYGQLVRLRLFPEQDAAAIEFEDIGASARARVHEDRRQMGRKPVRLSRGLLIPYTTAASLPFAKKLCTPRCHLLLESTGRYHPVMRSRNASETVFYWIGRCAYPTWSCIRQIRPLMTPSTSS